MTKCSQTRLMLKDIRARFMMGKFFLVMNVTLKEKINQMSIVTSRSYTMGKFIPVVSVNIRQHGKTISRHTSCLSTWE